MLPSSIINLITHNTKSLSQKKIKKSTMENLRNGEDNGSLIPFTFFDQSSVTIPLLKCSGLESSSSSSSSCDLSSSHSEEDESIDIKEEEEEEEEDGMTIEIKARGKNKTKPTPSSGKGGKHN